MTCFQPYFSCSSKEQAEALELGDGGEAGERAEGCEVCGVLRPHTEGTQERFRRGEDVMSWM